MLYLIIFAALFVAISQYVDKHLVNMGISKKDYFFYMCLSMIPFALIMLGVEIYTNQFKFSLELIPFLILIVTMVLRYIKQKSVVGCLNHLNPYEDAAYLTLGIILAFIIDIFLGTEKLKIISIISIFLTVFGVFLVANSKLKIRNLRIDLLTRIFTTLALGYCVHYMLQYWSNALFLLVLNVLLTLIFLKDYNPDYNRKNKKIIKWVFVQQIFGFAGLYISNILASNSVTMSNYVRPTSIVMVLLIAMLLKKKENRPSIKQIVGIVIIVVGLLLI